MRTLILTVVFLGVSMACADSARTQNVAAAEPIATLQRQLKQDGYNPGAGNGVVTEQTQRALSAYIARNGHPPPGLATDPVKQAQTGLQRLGLFAGPVDGTVGPETRDAILRFQAARHLAIDPRVSDTLLAALGDAAGTAPAVGAAAAPAAPPAVAASGPSRPVGRRPLPSWLNPPPIR